MLPPKPQNICLLLLAALTLAACGGSATPRLIGAYPRDAIATFPAPPQDVVLIYDAYVDLQVRDTSAAAEQAEDLAYGHGGYVSEIQSWYDGDSQHVTLKLAVPVSRYGDLRTALLGLGTVLNEQTYGTLTSYGDPEPRNAYSTITVHFSPSAGTWRWPTLPALGWNPLRTFRAAFEVSASI